jgi:hypothetical protein
MEPLTELLKTVFGFVMEARTKGVSETVFEAVKMPMLRNLSCSPEHGATLEQPVLLPITPKHSSRKPDLTIEEDNLDAAGQADIAAI